MTLRERTLRGLAWSAIARLAIVVSQFITTAILARLLKPSDFGVVAIALIFTEIAGLFGNLGIGNALIHKRNVDFLHYTSAFWLNVFIGLVFMTLLFAIAPFVATFYGKQDLKLVLKLISLNFLFSSFIFVQQSILSKEMQFKKLAIRDIFSVVIAGLSGIFCALSGFGVWSLVFQSLIQTFVNALSLWILSPWRPTLAFSMRHLCEVLPFSVNVTGSGILRYYIDNFDRIMIGKILGVQALGYYNLGYKVMMYPLYNVSWVLSKVLFPTFSIVQNDLVRMQSIYLKCIKGISLLTFPIAFGFFIGADLFVNIVYGPNWEPVVVLVRIMCFVGMIYSVTSVTGTIYWTYNKTSLKLKLDFINVFLTTAIVLIGLSFGLTRMTLLYSIYSFFWTHVSIFFASRIIKMPFWGIIASLLPAYFCSIISSCIMIFLRWNFSFNGFSGLFIFALFYLLIYLLCGFRYVKVKIIKGHFSVDLKD